MSIVTYTSCAYRLPCGICTRTNIACTVDAMPAAPVQPNMVSAYAAPAYPYNHMTIIGGGCEVEEERQPTWKFCPNCGAEMRKETEDEDNSQI